MFGDLGWVMWVRRRGSEVKNRVKWCWEGFIGKGVGIWVFGVGGFG